MLDEIRDRERLKALNRRRSAGIKRLVERMIPGLPVDADSMEMRHPIMRMDFAIDSLMSSLQSERDPFFDKVCEEWDALFPGLQARPGRFHERCLYLHVKSASINFMVRPKLPMIKRTLAKLEGTPKRFEVRLEIKA